MSGMINSRSFLALGLLACSASAVFAQSASNSPAEQKMDPFLNLMTKAWTHAKSHGVKEAPVLSPVDATVVGDNPSVNIAELHKAGFKIVSWTTDDAPKMKAQIALRIDGIISDRPDLLQAVVKEEREAAGNDAAAKAYFARFDVTAHRGGRGLRPENTLPSFENGLDLLVTTLETDTGVTTDHVSLIWHDHFLNPQSCRKADGSPYTLENKVFIKDISMPEAQKTFICDKLHFGPDQKNDLSLSPVAVAFAAQEHMMNPYVPTYAAQLFRFVNFYVHYYKDGAGKARPEAEARWRNAEKARFNLETKSSVPSPNPDKPAVIDTVDPQTFVKTLCGEIVQNHMEKRAEVQSFDFRTLQMVEEQYPKIPTYYLTGDPKTLSTAMVPESLR
jgi:glycerophosphoryl diester phosphodiesterase